MAKTFLRIADVVARVGLSKASIYRQIELGLFPKPVHLGPKIAVWIEDEIDAYQSAFIAERDTDVGRTKACTRSERARALGKKGRKIQLRSREAADAQAATG